MAYRSTLTTGSKCLLTHEMFGLCRTSSQSIVCNLRSFQSGSSTSKAFRHCGSGILLATPKLQYSVSLHPTASKKDTNIKNKTRNPDELSPDPNNPPVVIYEGILKAQIRSVKLFSITTSALGLAMQPMILEKLGTESMGALVAVFGMVGFFTYVTPFLIHFLAKRYVTDMTYDPANDLYSAYTYSFFLQRKELKFRVEDVIVPEIPPPFTTLVVKKEDKKFPLFLADTAFIEPKHFGRMMGYDKPIDFKLTVQDVQTAMKQKKSAEVKHKP